MDDARKQIAHARGPSAELQCIQESVCRFPRVFGQADRDYGTEIAAVERAVKGVGIGPLEEFRVDHFADLRVFLQSFRQDLGVRALLLKPQAECLDAAEDRVGFPWAQHSARKGQSSEKSGFIKLF